MSGGSFDYLYMRPDMGQLGSASEYQRMAASLARGGHYDAAALTLLLASHLQDAMRLARLLGNVHQAEEWRVSGDYGAERVALAVSALRDALQSTPFASPPPDTDA